MRDIDNPDDTDIREALIRANRENVTAEHWATLYTELVDSYENTEFDPQWGLEAINASVLYVRLRLRRDLQYQGRVFALPAEGLVPGAGVTVAFVDNGLDLGHWEFTPTAGSAERLPGVSPRVSGEIAPRQVVSSPPRVWRHGTVVASIVGAEAGDDGPRDVAGQQFHGVAWGSRLRMYAVALSQGDEEGDYVPLRIEQLASVNNSDARVFAYAINRTGFLPDIVNLSIGYPGLVENYTAMELRGNYGDAISVLTQAAKPDDRSVLVVAAGNDHFRPSAVGTENCETSSSGTRAINASSPQWLTGLPVHIPELRTHMVAVVAVDRNLEIADFSNRCGVAARWCVATPGDGVYAALSTLNIEPSTQADQPYLRGYDFNFHGTSAAAVFVSGSLAALTHFFSGQLSNAEVLERLLQTATRTPDPVATGAVCPDHLDTDNDPTTCELSSELGWGGIDLDAATAPVGATEMVAGSALPNSSTSMRASPLRVGRAFGDGFGTHL